MLGCTETVTFVRLVKRENDEYYLASVFDNVSWFEKTRIRSENTGVVYDNAVHIRIPAASIGSRELPKKGDHVIHGTFPLGAEANSPADLAKYGALKVLEVGDNRRGGLPHVVVIGK